MKTLWVLFWCGWLCCWSNQLPTCPAPEGAKVESIVLYGLGTTKPPIVVRELLHETGEPFRCQRWEREKRKLLDLDIFATVELQVDSTTGEGNVHLSYRFKELPPYIPFIVVSKSDQFGWSGGPGLASLNFGGQDIRLEMQGRFGGTTEYQLNLSSPWLFGLPIEYEATLLRVQSENPFDDFLERSFYSKVRLFHRLWPTTSLIYSVETFALRADSLTKQLRKGGVDFYPTLGGGVRWDARDARIHPQRGFYQETLLSQSGGFLGGAADFFELLSDSRLYLRPQEKWGVVLTSLYQFRSGSLGKSIGVYEDFHIGGLNSHRAFGNNHAQGKSHWTQGWENRFTLLPSRSFQLLGIDLFLGLESIVGVENVVLWNENRWIGNRAYLGGYTGLHLLVPGVERIRLEVGTGFAQLEVQGGVGMADKLNSQRWRRR